MLNCKLLPVGTVFIRRFRFLATESAAAGGRLQGSAAQTPVACLPTARVRGLVRLLPLACRSLSVAFLGCRAFQLLR